MHTVSHPRPYCIIYANSNHSKRIRSIPMQIEIILKAFQTLESKLEPYKRVSRNSNPKSNHSKGIQSIRIQIRTLQTRFEAFESKFEPFERDLKHSNANSNHSKGIRSTRTQILTIWNGILIQIRSTRQGIRMQIRRFLRGFEAVECKI